MYKARGQATVSRQSALVFGDKPGYLSPLNRSVVEGRTAHREHMKRHGVVEAGDIKLGSIANQERAPLGSPRDDITRTIQELNR